MCLPILQTRQTEQKDLPRNSSRAHCPGIVGAVVVAALLILSYISVSRRQPNLLTRLTLESPRRTHCNTSYRSASTQVYQADGQQKGNMSLVNLAHVCSHMQNASLARLGLTSVPLSKLHLSLSLHLQKQGFLSSVNLGGPSPPAKLLPPSSSEPSAVTSQQQKSSVLEQAETVTQENRASRRLWLGMKYWDGEPVLKKMQMLSKPTKRIWLDSQELGLIVRGRDAQFVRGMRGVGECIFVSTDRGIMEARECVERKIGGMVLCRVW